MKQTVVDQITVAEDGSILYREATVTIENEVQIEKTYHRTSLTPGQDLTNQPEKIVELCNNVWTQEIINAYQAKVAALEAK